MKRICPGTELLIILSFFFCACEVRKNQESTATIERDSIFTLSQGFIFDTAQPFPQCHASTVIYTAEKEILVAWFGGTHEKHDDVGIWLAKGKPGSWSSPIQVAKIRQEPHWNPVLFNAPSGKIILYFKVGKTIDNWETWYLVSDDQGKTWTAPKELVPGDKGGRGPVRNKPIILANGTWLAPASNEKKGKWNAFVDISTDQGKTWISSPFLSFNKDSISGEGVIQPALWQSKDGDVHMLLRSSAGVICRSDSKDDGITWSPIYKTSLPNPNSGIDLTQLSDGALALVYNRGGKNWGQRRPLSVTVSHDNGNTWPVSVDIAKGKEGDEFSYPSIVQNGDTLFAVYTWKRQRIAFWSGRVTKINSK